jgi:hypothetical protein
MTVLFGECSPNVLLQMEQNSEEDDNVLLTRCG